MPAFFRDDWEINVDEEAAYIDYTIKQYGNTLSFDNSTMKGVIINDDQTLQRLVPRDLVDPQNAQPTVFQVSPYENIIGLRNKKFVNDKISYTIRRTFYEKFKDIPVRGILVCDAVGG
jgi:hypothetical protein